MTLIFINYVYLVCKICKEAIQGKPPINMKTAFPPVSVIKNAFISNLRSDFCLTLFIYNIFCECWQKIPLLSCFWLNQGTSAARMQTWAVRFRESGSFFKSFIVSWTEEAFICFLSFFTSSSSLRGFFFKAEILFLKRFTKKRKLVQEAPSPFYGGNTPKICLCTDEHCTDALCIPLASRLLQLILSGILSNWDSALI